ncbi:hypothetical protein TNCV_3988821 [Trichonephila clavipes]|nr:hypothetical protein TNCV_3988821 [Trichonephila clavipes]
MYRKLKKIAMYHHVILSLGRVQQLMAKMPSPKITPQRYLQTSKQIIPFYEMDALVRGIKFNLREGLRINPGGCGRPVVKVSDHGWLVRSSSPVPVKTRRVGQRCTLNLSRVQTSSCWCGVIVRRGRYTSSGLVHVT